VSILATVDRDPGCAQVIETAEDLSVGLGHELVILHVKPENMDESEGETEIEEIVAGALEADITPEIRVVEEAARREAPTGRTASTIMRVAEDVDPAYLVIGSRKRTPVGKVLLGSVSQLVLRNAEVPVVTVEQTT
jgi:nucleotide-binding universal stress UspA family protein